MTCHTATGSLSQGEHRGQENKAPELQRCPVDPVREQDHQALACEGADVEDDEGLERRRHQLAVDGFGRVQRRAPWWRSFAVEVQRPVGFGEELRRRKPDAVEGEVEEELFWGEEEKG